MKKILPLLVVGILVLSGLGAVALNTNVKELKSETINYEKSGDLRRDFTHTVFVEYATKTTCPFCKYAHAALKKIYTSGDYQFYYVSLVGNKNSKAYNRAKNDYNFYGYPTVWFDGGYSVIIGGYTGVENDYRSSITSGGNRAVYDVDIDLEITWIKGTTEMEIDVLVNNNDASIYDGTIRVYITEIVSSMGWKDTAGQIYTFPFLDYAFNEDVSIPADGSWEDSMTWDGASNGFSSITVDNIMVIAAVFNDELYQGYSYPPNSNPFDAYYVDETTAILLNEIYHPPEKPDIDGPPSGEPGVEYEFIFNAVDTDNDDIKYHIDWGDDNSETTGFSPSGTDVRVKHTWSIDGTYIVKVIAEDSYGLVGPNATMTVTMPRNIAINTLFQWFLQKCPVLFPILLKLLLQLGLQ